MKEPIVCIAKNQTEGYVEKDIISSNHDWIDRWKVFVPRANNIGTELNDDNLNAFIGKPGSICTESYMFIGDKNDDDESLSINLAKYLKSKFK